MIETARGREGRGNLPHGDGDAHGEEAAHQPADRDREAAARAQRDGEGRDAAGEDADDGKGDGEVGEQIHPAMEFLRVAHLVQHFLVVLVHCVSHFLVLL